MPQDFGLEHLAELATEGYFPEILKTTLGLKSTDLFLTALTLISVSISSVPDNCYILNTCCNDMAKISIQKEVILNEIFSTLVDTVTKSINETSGTWTNDQTYSSRQRC